jgi:1-acyl-sn-glycerol-3-phosphate acyltransferase
MPRATPLRLSRGILRITRTKISVHNKECIPPNSSSLIVVSNHRSLFDAPLVMAAMNRTVRFVCHYYMSQVPVLRELVTAMGAYPLRIPSQRQGNFFGQSMDLLRSGQAVGIFPEGAKPMVQANTTHQLDPFHRGFAHLALRAPVDGLMILPVAITAIEEQTHRLAPMKLFRLIDPSEPMFHRPGWHPATIYRRVHLHFARPVLITDSMRQNYRGRQGGSLARDLTQCCRTRIGELLRQGSL